MNRIELLRKERNWSQQQLANELGLHQTAVSQWEQERTKPGFEQLTSLCNVFDVSLEYLMGFSEERGHFNMSDEEKEFLGKLEAKEIAQDDLTRLLRYFNQLNGEGKTIAADRIKELTKIDDYIKKE